MHAIVLLEKLFCKCYFLNSCSAFLCLCPNVPWRRNRKSQSIAAVSLLLSLPPCKANCKRQAAASVNFCSTSGSQKHPNTCLQQKILFLSRCWTRLSGNAEDRSSKLCVWLWGFFFFFFQMLGFIVTWIGIHAGGGTSLDCLDWQQAHLIANGC